MIKLLYIAATIILLIIIVFFVLGVISKNGQAPGLKDGQLQACASTENCVISETVDGIKNTIEPFTFEGDINTSIIKLKTAIESMKGEIVIVEEGYIASTFTSGIFGFVDDLEVRVTEDKKVHFRSSSRVGKSDLGANKKRVDELKRLLKE
ncbi:DUF1499 domain-containing protein [Psychromonas sp. RZ22]|uniref:DUF1499 domain-containing protein n=1 Tax=Psychromonas algarum TaxID=2555643 RepID=UPI00106783EE|nr:DUF1499 domain-containing protein [Psychromonas sp. RZ22]TEW53484.1 DUF1499 domain-containing protein [Psychromonas sp. RZ22]